MTGGTKGIGAAVVEVLRDPGAKVLAVARSAPDNPPEGRRAGQILGKSRIISILISTPKQLYVFDEFLNERRELV